MFTDISVLGTGIRSGMRSISIPSRNANSTSKQAPFDSNQSGNTAIKLGENNYDQYELAIDEIITTNNLQPQFFHAKKGDILIWHANLLHGGSKINEANLTRKSMVAHYYAEDVLCYHEISQRPAIIKKA